MTVPSVVVVQRRMTHYRVPFFSQLRDSLDQRGIKLHVAHGKPTEEERKKGDSGTLDWAIEVPTHYWLNGRICWLSFKKSISNADVVILTPENKLVTNLPVQYHSRNQRIILWGHGGNLQGNPDSLREGFKRLVARQADWWFGYTAVSLPLIARSGFPADRVTILENAIDTTSLAKLRGAVTPNELRALRTRHGLHDGPTAVFLGSLYADKRIDFLLEASLKLRTRVPNLQICIIGDGPLRATVDEFCDRHHWAHAFGALTGREKVSVLSLANVILNPGLVGLTILDSFVCQVPIATTDCGIHSPEIAYLRHGENGVMTPNTITAYVDAVAEILLNDNYSRHLRYGCEASSKKYTLANMVQNFVNGVEQCIESPKHRW